MALAGLLGDGIDPTQRGILVRDCSMCANSDLNATMEALMTREPPAI